MQLFFRSLALAAAAALSAPSQAALLTFDQGLDTSGALFAPLLNHTSELTQNGYYVDMFSTKAGATDTDLVGALVDGADVANTCVSLVCPTNNSTQFLVAVNDGLPVVGRLDGTLFQLKGFDASFVAAGGDAVPTLAMILRVVGFSSVGDVLGQQDFEIPGPTNGIYGFRTFATSSTFRNLEVSEIGFFGFACNAAGNCSRALDKGQFALDNLAVPEPSSAVLVGLALTALVAQRRRLAKV